jgi:cytochrome b561
MALKNDALNYGSVAKWFHWGMAIIIVGLLAIGFYMADMESGPARRQLYTLHKSVGFGVLILVVMRFAWRMVNSIPTLTQSRFLQQLGHINVWMLYGLMMTMALSGYVMTAAGGHPLNLFNSLLVPSVVAPSMPLARMAHRVHEYAAIILTVLTSLHVIAALFHHFVLRDRVLKGMLPRVCG